MTHQECPSCVHLYIHISIVELLHRWITITTTHQSLFIHTVLVTCKPTFCLQNGSLHQIRSDCFHISSEKSLEYITQVSSEKYTYIQHKSPECQTQNNLKPMIFHYYYCFTPFYTNIFSVVMKLKCTETFPFTCSLHIII